MQLCSNCGYQNLEGLMFCERCGVALGAVSVSTKQLEAGEDDYAAGSLYLSDEHIVMLHFVGFTDPVALQIEDQIILGRSSQTGSDVIAVNLEGYGASEQGVSRQHARLSRVGQQLFIQDLGSTNHTYLNGERLTEGRDYALRDGDEVALGRLICKVFFK